MCLGRGANEDTGWQTERFWRCRADNGGLLDAVGRVLREESDSQERYHPVSIVCASPRKNNTLIDDF